MVKAEVATNLALGLVNRTEKELLRSVYDVFHGAEMGGPLHTAWKSNNSIVDLLKRAPSATGATGGGATGGGATGATGASPTGASPTGASPTGASATGASATDEASPTGATGATGATSGDDLDVSSLSLHPENHLMTLQEELKKINIDAVKREKNRTTSTRRIQIQTMEKLQTILNQTATDVVVAQEMLQQLSGKLSIAVSNATDLKRTMESLQSSVARYELVKGKRFRVPSTSVHQKNMKLIQPSITEWKEAKEREMRMRREHDSAA